MRHDTPLSHIRYGHTLRWLHAIDDNRPVEIYGLLRWLADIAAITPLADKYVAGHAG